MQGIIDGYEKNWGAALEHLQKCSNLDPDFPALHFYLADAHYERGELKEARDEFRKYLNGPTESSKADNAREIIAHINQIVATGE